MILQEIRDKFLRYFEQHNHLVVPSSSLVPSSDDKSVLFTVAGMGPFKKIFSGQLPPPATNVVSVQRCLRVGGKHNDLENVGYTARHHTFFEMLGNFSFGGYFKREAIHLAWNFLTEVLKLPPEKLWITVYRTDEEAANIWLHEIKVSPTRFSRCDESDNFWSMGETGPCGPCSEIFYDHGPEVPGGPPGSKEEGERYVEIWNLVFMQYDRQADGSLVALPKPCVDTGMGLERVAAVMQGVHNTYETDVFIQLKREVAKCIPESNIHALNIIADHMRAIIMLIADDICPSNEGRGYVLRRIMRRALRHGYQSGIKKPFLHTLVNAFVSTLTSSDPRLEEKLSMITQIIQTEEEQFLRTLYHGLQTLEKALATLEGNVLPGALIFKLYDTYGFPVDLSNDLAREKGLICDMEAFEKEMALQKQRSQSHSTFNTRVTSFHVTTDFIGYTRTSAQSEITGLLDVEGTASDELVAEDKGCVILKQTPFYAESGGQVGDKGYLRWTDDVTQTIFYVTDTQKQNNTYLHYGYVSEGKLKVGMKIEAFVDEKRRRAIQCNHSATHLLHAVLRNVLGEKVLQKGSLVEAERLRFDFSYPGALSADILQVIEAQVNEAIWKNFPVETHVMSREEAQELGAMALFDNKYEDQVRVLQMGSFSTELCGGTHVKQTSEIGCFKILTATTIAAGVKRLEAVTEKTAFDYIQKLQKTQEQLSALLKTSSQGLIPQLEKQIALIKTQKKQLEGQQSYLNQLLAHRLLKRAGEVKGATLILAIIPSMFANHVKGVIDSIKKAVLKEAIIVLGVEAEGVQLSIAFTKNMARQKNAKFLISDLITQLTGRGGGRADFAHLTAAGNRETLRNALKHVYGQLALD